jgi:hypothetical protein
MLWAGHKRVPGAGRFDLDINELAREGNRGGSSIPAG